jgi:hypothetical protein
MNKVLGYIGLYTLRCLLLYEFSTPLRHVYCSALLAPALVHLKAREHASSSSAEAGKVYSIVLSQQPLIQRGTAAVARFLAVIPLVQLDRLRVAITNQIQ